MESFYAVVSAGGVESRIRPEKANVTHKIGGKHMINWVMDAVKEAGASKIIVAGGQNSEQIDSYPSEDLTITSGSGIIEVEYGLIQAASFFEDKKGSCLFICANKPLVTSKTINKLFVSHCNGKNAMTILVSDQTQMPDKSFNLCNLDETNESKKMYLEQLKKAIKESDILFIEFEWLERAIKVLYARNNKDIDNKNSDARELNGKDMINQDSDNQSHNNLDWNKKNQMDQNWNNQKQKSYNISKEAFIESAITEILNNKGTIGIDTPDSADECFCVNDRIDLNHAQKIANNRIIERHIKNGVTFLNPENCIVEDSVAIGYNTLIYPGTILEGSTSIKENCVIGPNTSLKNVCTGNRVTITNSVVIDSFVDDDTKVGPFAYLRPGSRIGKNVKIGDFVEIKKSSVGDDTKISHLTYVGDAEIGKNVNMGCGVVVVNYDGQHKNKTIVGDNSFIGCNVNLVSPVEVKPNAFIAAGSTITEDVPEYSLAIARSRQTIINDWVIKKGKVRGTKVD
jgi:bifunctional UDP-N-acetylglucosamine pyrophosphorylase/glucosamine-1-phosphate N-acetyltransferase